MNQDLMLIAIIILTRIFTGKIQAETLVRILRHNLGEDEFVLCQVPVPWAISGISPQLC